MSRAFAIPRLATAFALSGSTRKRPRVHEDGHLRWLRTLPCAVCGCRPVEAAHLRSSALKYGKPQTGGGRKPDDAWTLPLCPDHHRAQHAMNELAFYEAHGVDPFVTAMALWRATGDDEAGALILKEARRAPG